MKVTSRRTCIVTATAAALVCSLSLVPGRAAASSDPNVPVRLKDTKAFDWETNITIHVKDFPGAPTSPQVTLHYNDGSGVWQDAPFGFAGKQGDFWELAVTAPQSAEFVLRYDVLGATFWDNNDGQNYAMGPGFQVNGAPAACSFVGNYVAMRSTDMWWSQHAGTLDGKIIANDLGPNAFVGVVYTTDGWQSAAYAFGSFEEQEESGGCTSVVQRYGWHAGIGNDGHAPACIDVEFAVFFVDGAGTAHWDNNFNQNYKMSACGSASQHIE